MPELDALTKIKAELFDIQIQIELLNEQKRQKMQTFFQLQKAVEKNQEKAADA